MAKLMGVFSGFAELDTLSAEDLNAWLKVKEQSFLLENFIGNEILYPQTIPYRLRELEAGLAILREYIKRYPAIVYNDKTKKLIIPEELELRFPPLQKLLSALLDVLKLNEITPVIVQKINGSAEIVGSILRITPLKEEGFTDVNINGQLLKLELESVTILPIKEKSIVIQVESDKPVNVDGGSLGIVVDLRKS